MRSATVGIRDLKDHLSEYVRRVRQGEEIQVTSHGVVVAELVPPGRKPTSVEHPGIQRMIEEGRATLGKPNEPGLYTPQERLMPDGSALALLDEDRGSR